MSVKIYKGFVIDPVYATVQSLHHLIQEFRAEIRPLAEDYCLSAFILDAVNEFDRRRAGLVPQGDSSPCSHAWFRMIEAQNDLKRGIRHPRYDASMSLSLLPHSDGRILGIIHSEVDAWHELWLAKPGVLEYCYWDNTDRPDDVCQESWVKREQDWNEVLLSNPFAAPSHHGFTAKIHDEGQPPHPSQFDPAKVRACLPAMRARAHRVAMETVVPSPPEGKKLTHHYMLDAITKAGRDGSMEAEIVRLMAVWNRNQRSRCCAPRDPT